VFRDRSYATFSVLFGCSILNQKRKFRRKKMKDKEVKAVTGRGGP
jgi:hypothetical protein